MKGLTRNLNRFNLLPSVFRRSFFSKNLERLTISVSAYHPNLIELFHEGNCVLKDDIVMESMGLSPQVHSEVFEIQLSWIWVSPFSDEWN